MPCTKAKANAVTKRRRLTKQNLYNTPKTSKRGSLSTKIQPAGFFIISGSKLLSKIPYSNSNYWLLFVEKTAGSALVWPSYVNEGLC